MSKCVVCNLYFEPVVKRFRSKVFCSFRCQTLHQLKNKDHPKLIKIDPEILGEIKFQYENNARNMVRLAKRFNMESQKLRKLARRYNWKRCKKPSQNRTVYRKAASRKLGRKLLKNEQVHHIDGINIHNELNNLYVYSDAKSHTEAHGSLERVAFQLYRMGVISFNPQTGRYFLKELEMAKSKAHPGFKAVEAKIGQNPKIKNPGAVLAASSRNASKAAHKANPRLNRVKGK